MAGIVTGRSAKVFLSTSSSDLPNKGVSLWGLSDFTLRFSRDTVEQPLVGQEGNYRKAGKLTIEGSLTNCRFAASGNSDVLDNLVDPDTYLIVSGSTASDGLSWYFPSCQVTSYEITFGDASTITEASIDFVVVDAYNASYSNGHVSA